MINNLNANWQLDTRTQLGLQFGSRYVRSTFDGERYSGLSTLYGVDVRRELTMRFDVLLSELPQILAQAAQLRGRQRASIQLET